MNLLTVAVDAMSGDHGPAVVVPAAVAAVNANPQLKLLLVGKPEVIEKILEGLKPYPEQQLEIVQATQVVEMDDLPSYALRTKKDSSMRIALNLVKEGRAQGCVSAGNTGALVVTARFVLKTIPGVDRPAILFPIPAMKGRVHILDLGANVDCNAQHLYQFAVMGSQLVAATQNKPSPTVGLLNIGSEEIKGTEAIKEASKMLADERHKINYKGFVEGDDIYKGTVDVVVCDGFVGNVALKASEGLARMILHFAKQEFTRTWYTKLAAFLAKPVLKSLYHRINPNEYNGGSLLGLRGVVIKSHGGANISAMTEAIRVASREVEKNVPTLIERSVTARLKEA